MVGGLRGRPVFLAVFEWRAIEMKHYLGVVFASLLALSFPAFAVIDVSTVTAALTEGAAPIATIGLAVLVLTVGVKVFKMIRRAL